MNDRSPDSEAVERALSFFRRSEKAFVPAPSLSAGKVVGDFRLLSLMGQGGMGQVWEAEQRSLGNRRVAVKFVLPDRVTEKQLELFAREARAGGRLNHPGIVSVYGYGQSDGLAWIAMELVGGAWTLRDFLDLVARGEAVPAGYDAHVGRFVAEIAEAMHAAHEAGVIHRDLKPQNVLITPEDHPKITDFGLARITDEAALSHTGDFAGTYFYMSPEQVAARRAGIDHRTDIFSLGIVLYELLALRRPFQGDTEHQVAAQILSKDPPDPRTIRSKVPRDLAVVAGKALEKDRDKRFQTMSELAADLRRYLAHEPIQATPPTPLYSAVKWLRRNPGKSSAGAIVAVTFTVIAVLLVANVHANRAIRIEQSNLASANRQLAVTAKRERAAAEQSKTNEGLATDRAEEVLRLSALQKLDDLVVEAERLWPASPEILPGYEQWISKAAALVAELPDHQHKLTELRDKALPSTAEKLPQPRSDHPKTLELERARRHLEYHRSLLVAQSVLAPARNPPPESVGLDLAALPASASELNALAWPLVSPDRRDWGGEARGLVLARHAFALAADLSPLERAGIRDTLGWALFANGRFEEALEEERLAHNEAAADTKEEYLSYLNRLTEEIALEQGFELEVARSKHLANIERQIVVLEEEISPPPEPHFANAEDKWWHNQLEKVVNGLRAFSDPETGLYASTISPEYGWGVPKRAEFARAILARSVTGAEAAARWAEATASIASFAESPAYGGLRISPQVGLLPIGRDSHSGLWEFAHLQTGETAARGPDGKLILTEPTGLVFVLLPGGRFRMGAQHVDPGGSNYDPMAEADELPVHDVVLTPFFMSKYEMTQGQWLRIVGSVPNQAPRECREQLDSQLLPVDQLDWWTSVRTLGAMGLQLPSEAQWEFGARGGTTSIWWTGNDNKGRVQVVPSEDNSDGVAYQFTTVDELEPGSGPHASVLDYPKNPFGLIAVNENVWEWCLDGYAPYESIATVDPCANQASASGRVYRGGDFGLPITEARSAARGELSPSSSVRALGLRPARVVTQ